MKHAIGFLLYFLPLMLVAQNRTKDNNIWEKITREASFPGGSGEWKNYIEKSMAGIEIDSVEWNGNKTMLTVSFVIEKDGSVSGASVSNAKKYPQVLVRETIRIIENSPKWLPALRKGKPVKAYFKQPFVWKIEDE